MHKFRRLAGSVALFLCALSSIARAETTFYAPSPLEGDLEPEYAKAILKLRAGAQEDAVRALEALRAKVSGPSSGRDQRRILELEGLARQEQDDARRSREINERILSLVKDQKAPEAEGAPSVFAIAIADLKLGKARDARSGFERAHELGYNLPACHFFLGFLDYQERDLESSQRRFHHVLAAAVPAEVKGLAALYLSRIASMQGRGLVALRYAEEAREVSPDSKVRLQADEKLAAASLVEGFHETAGLDFRFDSNSAYLPLGWNPTDTGFASNDGPTGFGNELDVWLGYVSSPLDTWQWSIGAKSDILAHWTTAARASDFYDQRLDFVLSHRPLGVTSFGFKLGIESLWTTENLDPYHLRGNFEVYYRRELRPELVLLVELVERPTRNYVDFSVPDAADRSGSSFGGRFSLYSDTARPWWNPGLSAWVERNSTAGTTFRSTTFALDLNDLWFASDAWKGSMGVSVGVSTYSDAGPKTRTDPFVGLNVSDQYALSSRYFLRGTASYLGDFSNVQGTYRFSRFTLSAGFGIHI